MTFIGRPCSRTSRRAATLASARLLRLTSSLARGSSPASPAQTGTPAPSPPPPSRAPTPAPGPPAPVDLVSGQVLVAGQPGADRQARHVLVHPLRRPHALSHFGSAVGGHENLHSHGRHVGPGVHVVEPAILLETNRHHHAHRHRLRRMSPDCSRGRPRLPYGTSRTQGHPGCQPARRESVISSTASSGATLTASRSRHAMMARILRTVDSGAEAAASRRSSAS